MLSFINLLFVTKKEAFLTKVVPFALSALLPVFDSRLFLSYPWNCFHFPLSKMASKILLRKFTTASSVSSAAGQAAVSGHKGKTIL